MMHNFSVIIEDGKNHRYKKWLIEQDIASDAEALQELVDFNASQNAEITRLNSEIDMLKFLLKNKCNCEI